MLVIYDPTQQILARRRTTRGAIKALNSLTDAAFYVCVSGPLATHLAMLFDSLRLNGTAGQLALFDEIVAIVSAIQAAEDAAYTV